MILINQRDLFYSFDEKYEVEYLRRKLLIDLGVLLEVKSFSRRNSSWKVEEREEDLQR